MSKFCGSCGAPLNDQQRFCGKCGATNSPVQQTPAPSAPPAYTPVALSQPVAASAPTSVRSNSLLKVGIIAVVIMVVGGMAALGAVYYTVMKVKEKAEAASHPIFGDNTPTSPGGIVTLLQKATASASSASSADADNEGFKGDPCRFLSKEEVSRAVGIEIIRAQSQDAGCSYIAKGDPADMVSKHMTMMVTSQAKSNGNNPSADQTKLMQQITGAFFKQQESSDKELSKEAATGEVLILSVSFSTGNADLEMKISRLAFNRMKNGVVNTEGKTTDQIATGDLDGIGDEAYEIGGSGLIFRKGQTVVHMIFPECPCDAKAIQPLAASLASQL